jgi:class 3 adenylate cyclase
MHRDLSKLLHSATGVQQKVVAMFLDVRGFTSFAGLAESPDAADFLKSAYTRMLDDHITEPAYFKLTGDGMMVIYTFVDRDSLTTVLNRTVDMSIQLVDAFPDLTRDDPMINFSVPRNLGVGLARGPATMIRSGRKVLDYTGRPLNLAARLMDLARPSGVVFDGSFGIELLNDELAKRFSKEPVYIKGIAEEKPTDVYYLDGRTEIPAYTRIPIRPPTRFTEPTFRVPFSKVIEWAPLFQFTLTREPLQTEDVLIHVHWPVKTPSGEKGTARWMPSYDGTLLRKLNAWYAEFDLKPIVKEMEKEGCLPSWPVDLTIEYSVRDTPADTSPEGDNKPNA